MGFKKKDPRSVFGLGGTVHPPVPDGSSILKGVMVCGDQESPTLGQ